MLSDDGTPVLMDFGSTIKARIHVENRNQALIQQVCSSMTSSYQMLKLKCFYHDVGPRCRAKHDALPGTRTVRCQDWYNA